MINFLLGKNNSFINFIIIIFNNNQKINHEIKLSDLFKMISTLIFIIKSLDFEFWWSSAYPNDETKNKAQHFNIKKVRDKGSLPA